MVNGKDEEVNHRNRKKTDAAVRKHAMHLVRLLLTGIDLLKEGAVVTRRESDLPLLRGIRSGEVPLGEVFALAEDLDGKLRRAHEASRLPEEPDCQRLDELLTGVYLRQLEEGGGSHGE